MADASSKENPHNCDDVVHGTCAFSFPIKEWTQAVIWNDDTMQMPTAVFMEEIGRISWSNPWNPADSRPSIFHQEEGQLEISVHTNTPEISNLLESDSSKHSDTSTSSYSSMSITTDIADKDEDDVEPPKKSKRTWAKALPPCRVCAQPASGFHYGVNTCEACKMFFRRCMKRNKPLRCKAKTYNCHVGGVKREVCAYCRYRWCLALGMSRDSIKLGRYTLTQRDQNCREVTKMAAVTPQSVTQEEVGQLTDMLLEAHKNVFTNWELSEEEMLQRARAKKEQVELEQELFGNHGEVSSEEYEQIYRQTGLDVDGREKILRIYANCMELQIRGFVHFAKGIPGFRSLPLDDQANLLKAARAELLMLGVYRGFIHEYQIFVNPVGTCFVSKESKVLYGSELLQMEDAVARKLKQLNILTKGELVLLKAICLMFSDRCQLKAKDQVEEIQWKLVCVFLKSLQMNHEGRDAIRFSYVIDCLVELRTLAELNRKAHDNTPLTVAVFKNHPILMEVLIH